MKKLCYLFALIFACNAILVSNYCFADDEQFAYTTNSDNSITITNYDGSDEDVVIPQTIKGKTVTKIASKAFVAEKNMKSVTIPEGITEIEYSAFYNCTSLTKVYLNAIHIQKAGKMERDPRTNKVIVTYAFDGCTALKELYIGENYKTSSGCGWLFTDSFDTVFYNAISADVVIEYGASNFYTGDKVEIIPSGYNTTLKNIVISDNVTTISNEAFQGVTRADIVLPNSIKSIGSGAFKDLENNAFYVKIHYKGTQEQWDSISIAEDCPLKNSEIRTIIFEPLEETPSPTIIPIPTETPTPVPTLVPTLTPSPTPTSAPTATSSPTISPTPTPTITPISTDIPISSPTVKPTNTPVPTVKPTVAPTQSPNPTETPKPTGTPTTSPTSSPTTTPTETPKNTTIPTNSPSPIETPSPTTEPSIKPIKEIEPIGNYIGKVKIEETTVDDKVRYTVTSLNGESLNDITLFVAKYDNGRLTELKIGENELLNSVLNITFDLPSDSQTKIMLWDKNYTPIINVIPI